MWKTQVGSFIVEKHANQYAHEMKTKFKKKYTHIHTHTHTHTHTPKHVKHPNFDSNALFIRKFRNGLIHHWELVAKAKHFVVLIQAIDARAAE